MKKSNYLLTGLASLALAFSAHSQTTIADWTFETSQPGGATPGTTELTIGGITPETGAGTASGLHATTGTAFSSPAGNGSAHSFSSSDWAIGDYYQYQVSTANLANVTLSFDQTSSSTGPSQFQLFYSTDGSQYSSIYSYSPLINATETGPPATTAWGPTTPQSAFTFNVNLSSLTSGGSDGQSTLFLRVEDEGTKSENGGTVATAGTDRMDNVVFQGTVVPEPSTFAMFGIGSTVCLGFFRRFKK